MGLLNQFDFDAKISIASFGNQRLQICAGAILIRDLFGRQR